MEVDSTQPAHAQNSYRASLLLPPPGVGNLWLCSSLPHYSDTLLLHQHYVTVLIQYLWWCFIFFQISGKNRHRLQLRNDVRHIVYFIRIHYVFCFNLSMFRCLLKQPRLRIDADITVKATIDALRDRLCNQSPQRSPQPLWLWVATWISHDIPSIHRLLRQNWQQMTKNSQYVKSCSVCNIEPVRSQPQTSYILI